MKGYVINLKHQTDKLTKIQQTPNFNDVFEVFEAIDGTNGKLDLLDVKDKFDYLKAYEVETRPMSMSEICCSLSHNGVYQTIVNNSEISEDEFVLVCEDDINFIDNWLDRIQKLVKLVQDIPEVKLVSFQQSFIDHFNFIHKHQIDPKSGFTTIRQLDSVKVDSDLSLYSVGPTEVYSGAGSAFYMIRKSAARELANKVDYLHADFWQDKIGEKYIIRTNPVFGYADIEDSNLNSNRVMFSGSYKRYKSLSSRLDKLFAQSNFNKIKKQLKSNIQKIKLEGTLEDIRSKLAQQNSLIFKYTGIKKLKLAVVLNNQFLNDQVQILINETGFEEYIGIDGSNCLLRQFKNQFAIQNSFRKIGQASTPYDVANSLNHHNLHKLIAHSTELNDDDFTLILEPNIEFNNKLTSDSNSVIQFKDQVAKLIELYQYNKNINLINLCYANQLTPTNELDSYGSDLNRIIILKDLTSNLGQSCYLIRKSACKKLANYKIIPNLTSYWHETLPLDSIAYTEHPYAYLIEYDEPQAKFKAHYKRVAKYIPSLVDQFKQKYYLFKTLVKNKIRKFI